MKYSALFLFLMLAGVGILLPKSSLAQAIPVEIVEKDGKWELLRDGKPYYIKGVGGQAHLDRVVAYGANSVRTWDVKQSKRVLDEAHERGLTVLFGLWVRPERQGFDYDDEEAVAAQLEKFTKIVETYKDHPAILMWGIGNEVDLRYSNTKVWSAINDIAKMIHEKDPYHPTLTVTAGLDGAEVRLIQELAPHIDVYGINTYGGLIGIDEKIRAHGWNKPYIIAEWGPDGHWEVPKTAWGAPVEQTSTEKAAAYRKRYAKGIKPDTTMCLGSYVFLWGQKQETTPTWYGVFLEDGKETGVIDELKYAWTGEYPENRAPQMIRYLVEGKTRYDNLYVAPGTFITAKAAVEDPDGDELTYRWELLPESTETGVGGDAEPRPASVEMEVTTSGSQVSNEKKGKGSITFRTPEKEGPYRLFVYAYDGNGNAATANFPFFVRENP